MPLTFARVAAPDRFPPSPWADAAGPVGAGGVVEVVAGGLSAVLAFVPADPDVYVVRVENGGTPLAPDLADRDGVRYLALAAGPDAPPGDYPVAVTVVPAVVTSSATLPRPSSTSLSRASFMSGLMLTLARFCFTATWLLLALTDSAPARLPS